MAFDEAFRSILGLASQQGSGDPAASKSNAQLRATTNEQALSTPTVLSGLLGLADDVTTSAPAPSAAPGSGRGTNLGVGARRGDPAKTPQPSFRDQLGTAVLHAVAPDTQRENARFNSDLGLRELKGKEEIVNASRGKQTEFQKDFQTTMAGLDDRKLENATTQGLRKGAFDLLANKDLIGARTDALKGIMNAGTAGDLLRMGMQQDPSDPANLTAAGYNRYMDQTGAANLEAARGYSQGVQNQTGFMGLLHSLLPSALMAGAMYSNNQSLRI